MIFLMSNIMKFFQTYGFSYILLILLTFSGTWYFISNDNNKLASASEKSIASVVTISSFNNAGISSNQGGIGSGIVFSEDGYIVTNLHILSGQNINVKLNNGNNYPAAIIGIDQNADIAVF
jgi:Trypsin-like serine proteases, typically periplasmic, contain C-terminal PDZ domain